MFTFLLLSRSRSRSRRQPLSKDLVSLSGGKHRHDVVCEIRSTAVELDRLNQEIVEHVADQPGVLRRSVILGHELQAVEQPSELRVRLVDNLSYI